MADQDIQAIYPLSPTQQGILFHSLFAPRSAAYVVQTSWTLRGRLQAAALRAAWRRVVSRHPVLRTLFLWQRRETPLQVVRGGVRLPWREEDWLGLPTAEQQARVAAFLDSDRRLGFDLKRPPLLRVALLRLEVDRFVCVVSFHHLVLDGWSFGLLMQEVAAGYQGLTAGRQPQLPRRRPYRDYIVWLQQQGRQEAEAVEAHWRRRLEGFDTATPIPAATGRGRAKGERGFAEQTLRLAATSTAAMRRLVAVRGLTLNTLVQGAWALLLARYCGEPEVVFGVTLSGRPPQLSGVESMVGMFIQTLPLRLRAAPRAAVGEWLATVQQRLAELQEFPHVSLAEIQGWSEVAAGQRLFETITVFESYPRPVGAVDPGFRTEAFRVFDHTDYPLTLVVVPGERLQLSLRFDRAFFARGAVARLLGNLATLMQGMAADGEQRLAALPLLTRDELAQLVAWNATTRDHVWRGGLHERLEEQVRRRGEAVAVRSEQGELSYGELDRRANRLARYLRRLGVGAEERVGVWVKRSPWMVVSLLGVLKAGGVYVPLDPEYPRERLQAMVSDSGLGVLLRAGSVGEELVGEEPGGAGVRRVDVEREWEVIGQLDGGSLGVGVVAESLAYVIYTSGTTGRPKGVAVSHGGIVNRLLWMQEAYGLDGSDRVLQKTPLSFDVSVWEVFWPLLNGAVLVLARPGGQRDSAYLLRLLSAVGVTRLHFVPSMLRVFLEEEGLAAGSGVRAVYSSGETLSEELRDRFYERWEGVELHNLYGPTEASVDVTSWRCRAGERGVPIGRPIANTSIHIVDRWLQRVPVGVSGELCIGGVGLARGYLGRGGRTAAAFVPDPFGSAGGGGRLYRTGDRARHREDGAIEFLGRWDQQVKLRGQRVELGEIEGALRRQPGVSEAVVSLRREGGGPARLVAYVVSSASGLPAVEALRRGVGELLPQGLVPGVFVELESLPQTASGKLDRRALPAPSAQRPDLERPFTPPTSDLARRVAAIWRQVLGVEQVGIHDNFFDLGGDSIGLFQVHAALRGAFGSTVPLVDLLRRPTIDSLSLLLRETRDASRAEERTSDRRPAVDGRSERRALLLARRQRARQGGREPSA